MTQLPALCSAVKLLATSLSFMADSAAVVLQASLYASEKRMHGGCRYLETSRAFMLQF